MTLMVMLVVVVGLAAAYWVDTRRTPRRQAVRVRIDRDAEDRSRHPNFEKACPARLSQFYSSETQAQQNAPSNQVAEKVERPWQQQAARALMRRFSRPTCGWR
jgi:hypothetical protein